jgi:hypothetical protein
MVKKHDCIAGVMGFFGGLVSSDQAHDVASGVYKSLYRKAQADKNVS